MKKVIGLTAMNGHFFQLVFFFVLVLSLSACDKLADKAGAEIVKFGWTKSCDDDEACQTAVKEQFDACHERYRQEWRDYNNASFSKEDEKLEIYSEKMFACIVDENGQPYFMYDPH